MRRVNQTMPTAIMQMGIILLLSFALPCSGAETKKAPTAVAQKIIPFKTGLKVQDLAAHQDSDIAELPNKRRISVGNLRRLEKAQQRMLAAQKGSKVPPGLQAKPVTDFAQARPFKTRENIREALKLPDTASVQLPNGKTATVAQIKYVLPEVEKRLGHKFGGAPTARPDRSGSAIQVSVATSKAEWANILKKPDSTVIESAQNKKRITVGELKQFLAMRGKTRTPGRSPQGTTGLPATPQMLKGGN